MINFQIKFLEANNFKKCVHDFPAILFTVFIQKQLKTKSTWF